MNKIILLFITLFLISSSFFIGYFFGQSVSKDEFLQWKNSLQVSLHLHGNTLDIEKSHSDIRVIVDGKILSGSGSIELKK